MALVVGIVTAGLILVLVKITCGHGNTQVIVKNETSDNIYTNEYKEIFRANLRQDEDKNWQLKLPNNILCKRATDKFVIELPKSFVKSNNGKQLLIAVGNGNDVVFASDIDSEETEKRFN